MRRYVPTRKHWAGAVADERRLLVALAIAAAVGIILLMVVP